MTLRRLQTGFGMVTAIFMLLIMASLAGYLVRVSSLGQFSSAIDFDRARAYQAAQAGVQWAGYQIYKAASNACTAAGVDVALDATGFPGIGLTVTCTPTVNGTVTTYTVFSVACNVTSGTPKCPASSPGTGYVEQAVWARFEK